MDTELDRHCGKADCLERQFNLIKKLKEPINVCVTGAAGRIAFSLLYMIGRGEVFGKYQPINLSLLELPVKMRLVEGLVMELEDSMLYLISKINVTSDPQVSFLNADVIFMAGGATRREGMEHRDLLKTNVQIMKQQAKAINAYASKNVKVLVLVHPTNTNAFICSTYAPSIPKENFSAMSRIAHNRIKSQIAKKLGIPVTDVHNVIAWGNNTTSQVPDVGHATVLCNGTLKPVWVAIEDIEYLRHDLIHSIQRRGAAILSTRKVASALSAAKGACEQMHDWWQGTKHGEFVSMAVMSDGSYNIPKDIVFSFPVLIRDQKWSIVQGLLIDDFTRDRLIVSIRELEDEKKEALNTCMETEQNK